MKTLFKNQGTAKEKMLGLIRLNSLLSVKKVLLFAESMPIPLIKTDACIYLNRNLNVSIKYN